MVVVAYDAPLAVSALSFGTHMGEAFADVETSSLAYARRFSGRLGEWLIEVQSRGFRQLFHGRSFTTALDVGGGHAQLIPVFEELHCRPVVVGSSSQCEERLRPFLANGRCEFRVASLSELPFDEQSFDVVASIRLLPHFPEWERLVSELCRVSKRYVLVDYPLKMSINLLTPLLFPLKKKIEGDTRPYRLFERAEVSSAFRRCGFRLVADYGQFVVPMALHRKLNAPRVSQAVEACVRTLGLHRCIGSPVISLFERETTGGT